MLLKASRKCVIQVNATWREIRTRKTVNSLEELSCPKDTGQEGLQEKVCSWVWRALCHLNSEGCAGDTKLIA